MRGPPLADTASRQAQAPTQGGGNQLRLASPWPGFAIGIPLARRCGSPRRGSLPGTVGRRGDWLGPARHPVADPAHADPRALPLGRARGGPHHAHRILDRRHPRRGRHHPLGREQLAAHPRRRADPVTGGSHLGLHRGRLVAHGGQPRRPRPYLTRPCRRRHRRHHLPGSQLGPPAPGQPAAALALDGMPCTSGLRLPQPPLHPGSHPRIAVLDRFRRQRRPPGRLDAHAVHPGLLGPPFPRAAA